MEVEWVERRPRGKRAAVRYGRIGRSRVDESGGRRELAAGGPVSYEEDRD